MSFGSDFYKWVLIKRVCVKWSIKGFLCCSLDCKRGKWVGKDTYWNVTCNLQCCLWCVLAAVLCFMLMWELHLIIMRIVKTLLNRLIVFDMRMAFVLIGVDLTSQHCCVSLSSVLAMLWGILDWDIFEGNILYPLGINCILFYIVVVIILFTLWLSNTIYISITLIITK